MGLYPTQVREYLAGKIPFGPLSQIYLFDPVNGNANNNGLSWEKPFVGLTTAALANLVSDQHDTAVLLAGDTADNPAAAINWNKDYTHLVGLTNDLPGMGQRCRIVGTAALDLAQIITFAGAGCLVKNIQFFNGGDAAGALGAGIVSGDRNAFENCFFAGMGHATPGAEAAGFSLKVTGAENYFKTCVIGLDTVLRAAANAELIVSGPRNTFEDCLFLSYSVTPGKFMARVDNTGGDMRWVRFKNCAFYNYTPNWVTGITDCFDLPAGAPTFDLIMEGWNTIHGQITGWANNVAHLKTAMPTPTNVGGVVTAENA